MCKGGCCGWCHFPSGSLVQPLGQGGGGGIGAGHPPLPGSAPGSSTATSGKKQAAKSKEELAQEKKKELEKRLQDVSGQLSNNKKPAKKGTCRGPLTRGEGAAFLPQGFQAPETPTCSYTRGTEPWPLAAQNPGGGWRWTPWPGRQHSDPGRDRSP